ncbi:MAG: CBS domain-containing protein, partial [Candidatus Hermodarchaeota archaeon]
LKSGTIEINNKEIKCSSMSSLFYALKIADTLKEWIEQGKFLLNPPAERLSLNTIQKPMKQKTELKFVKDLKKRAVICYDDCDLKTVAEKIINENMNHIIITNRENILQGIVTSFDVTRAIAENKLELKQIITRKVITTSDNELLELAARKMKTNEISALPVINDNREVVGIITAEELM